MKEALLLMAKHNKHANSDMAKCFKMLKDGDFNKDLGLYYKSIYETCYHVLSLNNIMFTSFIKTFCKDSVSFKSKLGKSGELIKSRDEFEKKLSEKAGSEKEALIDAMISIQNDVDDLIIDVIENIDDFNKDAKLEFPKVAFIKPRYQIIMGILSHSAHHRGQIASALDILKVDNDFAGMLGL